jgi:hypothetical protein
LKRQLGLAAAAGLPCFHAPRVASAAPAVDVRRNNLSGLSM